jgi:hypothetical protein
MLRQHGKTDMKIETVRNDDQVQTGVQALFEGVVPEKNAELKDLWKKYSPRFNVLEDVTRDGRFIMDAGAYREVRFNHRALRAFWLAAFIAWEGYRAVSEYVRQSRLNLDTFDEMLQCFERILTVDDPVAVPLPDGVPEPGILPDAASFPEQRATAELAIFAVGWALLHEVRHIKHQQEGTAAAPDGDPAKRREEESSCDDFATEFLISEVGAYAASQGVEPALVRQKRESGIYFALFALTLRAKDRWGESDSHPAIQARINGACQIIGPDEIGVAAAVAQTAFAALRMIWPAAPAPFN